MDLMDPRVVLVLLFIAFRIFRAIRAHSSTGDGRGAMSDLSKTPRPTAPRPRRETRGENILNPMNRRQTGAPQPARHKPTHKRNPDDPFDGMNGDVTEATLTMDDIVT